MRKDDFLWYAQVLLAFCVVVFIASAIAKFVMLPLIRWVAQ